MGTEAKKKELHPEETGESSGGGPQGLCGVSEDGWAELVGGKGWNGVVISKWLEQVAQNRGSLTN